MHESRAPRALTRKTATKVHGCVLITSVGAQGSRGITHRCQACGRRCSGPSLRRGGSPGCCPRASLPACNPTCTHSQPPTRCRTGGGLYRRNHNERKCFGARNVFISIATVIRLPEGFDTVGPKAYNSQVICKRTLQEPRPKRAAHMFQSARALQPPAGWAWPPPAPPLPRQPPYFPLPVCCHAPPAAPSLPHKPAEQVSSLGLEDSSC